MQQVLKKKGFNVFTLRSSNSDYKKREYARFPAWCEITFEENKSKAVKVKTLRNGLSYDFPFRRYVSLNHRHYFHCRW